ncbi:MAG TPA: CAP domain-containing protein [Acidimicrobiia bacterium]|nr:CAP domain-containing protein [Acidimicrobiia bacterium]
MRKIIAGVVLALALGAFPQAARADQVSDEAAFVAQINALRAGRGLPTLQVHPNLVDKARAWSATMTAAGKIWHSTLSDGITADWVKLGENVGMGGSVDSLHKAFVASPKHFENLIDPDFTYLGIGVVYAPNGTIFVSEMFMKLAPAPTPTTVTTRPAPAPAPAPAPVAAPRPAATVPAPAPAPVAAPPVEVPPAPVAPPRVPSALLVSVLQRLHTFDS